MLTEVGVKSYVMKANNSKLSWQMKGTKPLLQIVNNLYLAHALFEHSTTWHTCLFSCIRLFLDKLLKINSPCTPHMRCTVAFNNVMTECTYSYKKEGAVIRAHSVFARYWVTLKLDRTLLPKVELTLSIALSVR